MIDLNTIEALSTSLSAKLPNALEGTKKEIEANITAVLQQHFSKLNLVTKEEFDVQAAVLARTREKLEKLETILSELNAHKNS